MAYVPQGRMDRTTAEVPPTDRPTTYLDHAATSYPKPEEVTEEIVRFLRHLAGSPGRSGHRLSGEAARVVFETREALARLFGVSDSRRVVFTRGATEGLNLALFGILRPGDHVLTTSMEHNAVMRPLRHLAEKRGVKTTIVRASPEGVVDPDDIRRAVRPNTRLAVVNHGSNVCGALQPLAEIVNRLAGRTLLVVDAAQTAGLVPLHVEEMGVDILAASGHKGLLGPTGIGALCLREGVEPEPLLHGGTGSRSESDEQPDFLPDRYEAGTPNTVGIAGLAGALRFLERSGPGRLLARERALASKVVEAMEEGSHVRVYGPRSPEERLGLVALRVEGLEPGEVGRRLDREYGFLVRCGLHCAPNAHRTLGTFPEGSVRVSVGFSNTPDEIDRLIGALSDIAHG